MKIFKNRGDIYISKSGYKSSKEERILLILLAIIVIFTIVFVVLLSQKYSSISQFFADGEVTVTQVEDDDEVALPSISGKNNFLVIETDNDNTTLHYVYLLQSDNDNVAYKVATLSPKTMIDNDSISDIYFSGGGAELQKRLTEYFGFEIDYYAQFETADFVEFVDELGSFIYPVYEDIKFDGGKGDDEYSVRFSEGENTLNGKKFSNLLRYYCTDSKNYASANELVLYGVTSLFNSDNYDDCESLFRLFIKNSSTNITVRDFEKGKDSLMVFCYRNSDLTIYSAVAEYEDNVLTKQSIKNIKGYFNK
jgi:anionic cell wall polymer biosynthesis LytR-Cps2A-Psr (LCP) family protein